jgi:hypothetical protein
LIYLKCKVLNRLIICQVTIAIRNGYFFERARFLNRVMIFQATVAIRMGTFVIAMDTFLKGKVNPGSFLSI